jgi:hypothetical protein
VTDCDVAVVGGGPTGCSAAVFTAREGLDTVLFDCGRSSLQLCAYLENYLGFPAGIDIETLYDLFHAHARETGVTIVPKFVASVEDADAGGNDTTTVEEAATDEGFLVHPQDGEPITTRRVIAATRYDGEYLRGLDDEEAMFDSHEHGGETEQFFDREYADADGTTPVEGLYVASPHREADMQAIVAAGRGARVARQVITDARVDDGWWPAVAEGVDWMRRDAERDGRNREYWLEHFDEHYGETAPVDADTERYRRIRETAVEQRLAAYLTDEEIAERTDRGHRTLAAHLDPGAVLAAVATDELLAAVDTDELLDAVDPDELLGAVDDDRLLDAVDAERIQERAAAGETRGGEQ